MWSFFRLVFGSWQFWGVHQILCRVFLSWDFLKKIFMIKLGWGLLGRLEGKVPLSSHQRHVVLTRWITDDVNPDRPAAVLMLGFSTVELLSTHPAPYCALSKEIPVWSPHLRCGELCSFLRGKWLLYLNEYSLRLWKCAGSHRKSHILASRPLNTNIETQLKMPHEFPKQPLGGSTALLEPLV